MDAESVKFWMNKFPWKEITDHKGTQILISCPVRMAFNSLAKPRDKQQKQKDGTTKIVPTWGATFLLPEECTTEYLALPLAAVNRVAVPKFGDAWRDMVKSGQLRLPFRKQAERHEKYPKIFGSKGFFIDTESQYEVKIAAPTFGPDGQLNFIPPSEVRNGYWFLARLVPYAYDSMGQRGMKFGLRGMQLLCQDEIFKGEDRSLQGFGAVDFDGAPAGSKPAAAPASAEADLWN